MRALVLEDWWKLVVAQRPDPVPTDNQVLIEVLATGICGSDLHGLTGENGRREHGQIMGHETVGRIVAVGSSDSEEPSVGDVVTVNPVIGCGACDICLAGNSHSCEQRIVIGVTPALPGAFAEYLAAPAANVVPLPENMPFEHGALVEPLAVGYHAVRRAPVRAGSAVLVVGGGPIGQACVLASIREGAQAVVVSEIDAARRQLSERLGAATIDPRAVDDLPRAVRNAGGAAPDLVVDAVGSTTSLRDSLVCAPPGAAVVLVGMGMPDVSVPAYEISTKERSIVGSFCYTPAEFRDTALWAGTVPTALSNLIDERVSLSDAPAAAERLARGTWQASKVLVYSHSVPTE